MVELEVAIFLGLDGLSFLLAATLALFFWKSHRIDPEQSFGVLGASFTILALAQLTPAIAGFGIVEDLPVFAAIRGAGVLLAGLLILCAYAARYAGAAPRTLPALAWTTGSVATLFILTYLLPGSPLGDPDAFFPWLRLLDALLLILAALLVTVDVRPSSLRELPVPAAFLCLALSRYTAAMLAFEGNLEPNPLVYAWRLLGLILLVAVVLRRWPRETP